MNAAKNGAESAKESTLNALGTAKHGVEVARESTMHTVASAVSMIMKGVTATAGVLATLQRFNSNDGLAWFGLARRRSPLFTVAAFGAGAAVGAGVALLLAPTSGADLRSSLLGRVKSAGVVEKVEAQAAAATAAVKRAVDDAKQTMTGAAPVEAAPQAAPHNGKPAIA